MNMALGDGLMILGATLYVQNFPCLLLLVLTLSYRYGFSMSCILYILGDSLTYG
jgi:hypothetical protein